MSLINIGGDSSDASYRYKMPKIFPKVEGRGNGIKTVIVNMHDIAKALHVDPAYPTKFFGIELGAQSKYSKETERAIVNGNHGYADLAKTMDKFIDTFVLCPTCRLPEIKMQFKKGNIKIDCAACGHNGVLQTTHKLLTVILKDYEAKKKEKKEKKKGEKGDKNKKKKKKDVKDKEKEENKVNDTVEKPKKKKDKPESKIEWVTDTSKSAVKKRKEEEFAEMQRNDYLKSVESILSENSAEGTKASEMSASTVLKIYIAGGKRTGIDIFNEMKRLQLSRGLDEPQRMKVLLEAIIEFSDPKNIANSFVKNAEILKMFCRDRSSANILLCCIEEFVGVIHMNLLSRTPLILQALYEADIIEEDAILSWYNSPPESSWLVSKDVAVQVREKSKVFINWLMEAEEEDDEEE